jgi:hypothetical protein
LSPIDASLFAGPNGSAGDQPVGEGCDSPRPLQRPPSPATRQELVARANAALPPGLRISYRPRVAGGGRSAKPYHVLVQEQDVAALASIEAAALVALRRRADLHLTPPRGRGA